MFLPILPYFSIFRDRLWITAGGIAVGGVALFIAGRMRERAKAHRLVDAVLRGGAASMPGPVDFAALATLPAPVARYFRQVLTDGQPMIAAARMRQRGELRADLGSPRWSAFTAHQIVAPPAPGFVWQARVAMPFAMQVGVLDSYVAGRGAGRVSLLAAIPVAAAAGAPELNAGALHRYLAEAVWYPTALLPQAGVRWTAIDDGKALATLTDRSTTVALEFHFDAAGEVAGIYTPVRYGRFGGTYRQMPWEGHFRDYETHDGMRVPAYGEVGWHAAGAWQAVWRGRLTDLRYTFAR